MSHWLPDDSQNLREDEEKKKKSTCHALINSRWVHLDYGCASFKSTFGSNKLLRNNSPAHRYSALQNKPSQRVLQASFPSPGEPHPENKLVCQLCWVFQSRFQNKAQIPDQLLYTDCSSQPEHQPCRVTAASRLAFLLVASGPAAADACSDYTEWRGVIHYLYHNTFDHDRQKHSKHSTWFICSAF